MKKSFLKSIFTSMLILLLCLNVFASPSPETDGFVPVVLSATDANGNAITVTLNEVNTTITADAMKTETIQNTMGDAYTVDMIVIDVQDITVPAGTLFPVTLTFTIKGVTADTKGGVMLWTGSAWEWIDATFGTDTMTITFDLLTPTGRFPIAFVMNADVTQNQVGTSPQTSDCITAAFTVLAISAMAALVFSKKRSKA